MNNIAKVRKTTMIGEFEVEREPHKVGNLTVYTWSSDCQFEPEIVTFFVDDKGNVVGSINFSASGGPEGSCGVSLEVEKVD